MLFFFTNFLRFVCLSVDGCFSGKIIKGASFIARPDSILTSFLSVIIPHHNFVNRIQQQFSSQVRTNNQKLPENNGLPTKFHFTFLSLTGQELFWIQPHNVS